MRWALRELALALPQWWSRCCAVWSELNNWSPWQGIFRLIQSIPRPKAEPFKSWLAKVGKERLDEIENPELAMGRMQELFEKEQ